jgi:hypothetical protein
MIINFKMQIAHAHVFMMMYMHGWKGITIPILVWTV